MKTRVRVRMETPSVASQRTLVLVRTICRQLMVDLLFGQEVEVGRTTHSNPFIDRQRPDGGWSHRVVSSVGHRSETRLWWSPRKKLDCGHLPP